MSWVLLPLYGKADCAALGVRGQRALDDHLMGRVTSAGSLDF